MFSARQFCSRYEDQAPTNPLNSSVSTSASHTSEDTSCRANTVDLSQSSCGFVLQDSARLSCTSI
ncbi:hypothetical protein E2C01_052352 [Portunus trituberculatus]|uniref:Uncharacterized protein n=1 Tax=Portunus trituberculatus TaxID=210409 RepID=A0A5B7GEC5_PORTR|nr:hypothetical protein [Portunus trituberculatus]